MGRGRQARLRREYAAWYPSIELPTWHPAKKLAGVVARQLLKGEPRHLEPPRWEPGPRILDDRHFEFRGGEAPRPSGTRTRREDHQERERPARPTGEAAGTI